MKAKLVIIFSVIIAVFSIMLPSSVFGETEIPLELSISGRIEGVGTYFEIQDSEYLDITLRSTEEIKVVLESIPRMISLDIEAASENIDSAELTIEGLEPNKTYYKYQDSYKNGAVFISSENGSYNWIQDLSQPHHIWIQEIKGTIFLPEDCNIYGNWNETTQTCMLNQDLTESVEITENNIILDGNGHSITGSGGGYGIYLNSKENVTIKNCTVTNFSSGISLRYSFNNDLIGNSVSTNGYGIAFSISSWNKNNTIAENEIYSNRRNGIILSGNANKIIGNNISGNGSDDYYGSGIYSKKASYNTISNNNISSNKSKGILFVGEWSGDIHNNIITNNIFSDNPEGFYLYQATENTIADNIFTNDGLFVMWFTQNIVENNTVNGKPLVYLEDISDQKIEDAGQVILINCDNITVGNLDLSNTVVGIELWKTSNSKITNNKILNARYGLYLAQYSSGNLIGENDINFNREAGIYLSRYSDNNTLVNNNTSNNSSGIYLSGSSNNTLTGNIISLSSKHGVYLAYSLGYSSNNNTLTDNTISSNHNGVYLGFESSYNKIYHNNFIDNDIQAIGWIWIGPGNLFDNGYPDGGNYWSDYTGVDFYNGPEQDQTGSDRIGDFPYTFTGGEDKYPFIEENGWEVPPIPIYNVAVILAEPNDVNHISSSIEAQPCKLLSKKTYPNGHSKEYYQDLAYCVADYHKENSFGTVNLSFTIYDNGEWFKTDKNEQDYLGEEDEFVKDAISLAENKGIDLSNQDVVVIVHSGTSYQKDYIPILRPHPKKLHTSTWTPNDQPLGCPPYKIITAEDDVVGGWAHEIGHIIGAIVTPENTITPDLYEIGNVGKWDLMADGAWNNGLLFNKGTNPPFMSSYIKEFLQWLNYDIYPKSAYGEYWINSLETSKLEDKVFRYNLTDDVDDESSKYYILETRNRDLKTWDSSLPELTSKHLVLYYVDTKGLPEYGYVPEDVVGYQEGMMWNQYRNISIPGGYSVNDGVLSPLINETYRDLDNLVKFTALTDRTTDDRYEIQADIEEITYDSFGDIFWGVVLKPKSTLKKWIGGIFNPNSIKTSEFYKIKNNFEEMQLTATSLNLQEREGEIGIPVKYSKGETIRIIKIISFEVLISIILLNLLLILLNKKVLPRWRLEKTQRAIKIIMKILWIISIIVVIVSIFLLVIVYTAPEPSPKSPGVVRTVPNNDLRLISVPPIATPIFPDLDLHLYCDDGRHVGMNYGTGEYEVQILGAIVSGDNQDAPEWIFVPEDISNCHFVVSSYDNQRFLEENPEIAQGIEDTTDSYEIYARYIDPEIDIYTSITISQEIEAGIQLEHSIAGTDDVIINPGEVTIDSIISEIYQYFSLNWIDKSGIKDSLVFKLNSSKRKIEEDQKQVAINILNAFINEVEVQGDKHIKINIAELLIKNAKEVIGYLQ